MQSNRKVGLPGQARQGRDKILRHETGTRGWEVISITRRLLGHDSTVALPGWCWEWAEKGRE